jgi:hypothetical protein
MPGYLGIKSTYSDNHFCRYIRNQNVPLASPFAFPAEPFANFKTESQTTNQDTRTESLKSLWNELFLRQFVLSAACLAAVLTGVYELNLI